MSKRKSINPAKHCSDLILTGKLLTIDPSTGATGNAGWAEFESGRLTSWGVIELKSHKNVYKRFKMVANILASDFQDEYDVLSIELLKGRYAHFSLKQVVAVFSAVIPWKEIVAIVPTSWQAIANHIGGHIKRDDIDAVYIGYATICLAEGYKPSWKSEDKDEFVARIAAKYDWSTGPWP